MTSTNEILSDLVKSNPVTMKGFVLFEQNQNDEARGVLIRDLTPVCNGSHMVVDVDPNSEPGNHRFRLGTFKRAGVRGTWTTMHAEEHLSGAIWGAVNELEDQRVAR